ncbi:MAG: hypothetical protein MI922_11580 [Bacteroidales bacterium]|nr:hypothetical protein [Bacteroidales bacterium]
MADDIIIYLKISDGRNGDSGDELSEKLNTELNKQYNKSVTMYEIYQNKHSSNNRCIA